VKFGNFSFCIWHSIASSLVYFGELLCKFSPTKYKVNLGGVDVNLIRKIDHVYLHVWMEFVIIEIDVWTHPYLICKQRYLISVSMFARIWNIFPIFLLQEHQNLHIWHQGKLEIVLILGPKWVLHLKLWIVRTSVKPSQPAFTSRFRPRDLFLHSM